MNFNTINHQCRGEKLHGSVENYKTVSQYSFKKYPKQAETNAVSAARRN